MRTDTEGDRIVVTLRRELHEAIMVEDYGRAALLRDQIKKAMHSIQESR